MPVSCKLCEPRKNFKKLGGLKTHYTKVHPDDIMPIWKCEEHDKEWSTEWSQKVHNEKYHSDDPKPKPKPKPLVKASGEEFDLFSDIDMPSEEVNDVKYDNNLETDVDYSHKLEKEIKVYRTNILELEKEKARLKKSVKSYKEDIELTASLIGKSKQEKDQFKVNIVDLTKIIETYKSEEKILSYSELKEIADGRVEFPVDDSMVPFLVSIANKICELFDIDSENIPMNVRFEAVIQTVFNRIDLLKNTLQGVEEELNKK